MRQYTTSSSRILPTPPHSTILNTLVRVVLGLSQRVKFKVLLVTLSCSVNNIIAHGIPDE